MLLTTGDINAFTGIFVSHFETFSQFSNVAVHKEPTRSIVVQTGAFLPGYEISSNEENYTMTPVSGVYRCMIINERNTDERRLTELNARYPGNKIKIKVENDCYNFVKDGKNELFEVNGISYNYLDNAYVQNYLGARFYILELRTTI